MEKRQAINRQAAVRMTAFTARDDDRGEPVIEGYFAVFGDVYQLWDGVTESIAPGAFAGAIGGDVRALVNHDTSQVLGRTKSGTLSLREDERGLYGSIRVNPDDQAAMDLYARVRRGDVDQCSFGFDIAEERAEAAPNGGMHFTILRVDPLYEVSPVTFPAYASTHVEARKRDVETARKRATDLWRASMRARVKGDV